MCVKINWKRLCSREGFESTTGLHEIGLWSMMRRQILLEFLGTFFLIIVGCGAKAAGAQMGQGYSSVQTALGMGLIAACVVWVFGDSSGGHMNPAVTVGLLVAGYVYPVKALLFVASQCGGAVLGALCLLRLSGVGEPLQLTTAVSARLTLPQACAVEALTSCALVLTACAASLSDRDRLAGPFAIGFSVAACHLFAMPYTGASMNPARSFGPAMVTETWNNHWVYWVGPLAGGVAAGILHRLLFRPWLQDKIENETEDSQGYESDNDIMGL